MSLFSSLFMRFYVLFLACCGWCFLIPNVHAFSDVSGDHPYFEPISYLQEKGSMGGYKDGSFQPMKTLNRAEFIKTVISSKYTGPLTGYSPECLSDIAKDAWYEPYVCFAKARGIISGYKDHTFRPEKPISVAEGMKIIATLFEFSLEKKEEDLWYTPYARAFETRSLILPSLFSVSQELRRGEVSEILWRVLEEKKSQPSKAFSSLKTELCVPLGEEMPKTIDMDKVRSTWLSWYNEKRKAAGLAPYHYNAQLTKTAYLWSKSAAKKGSIDHKREGTSSYYDFFGIRSWFKNLGLTFQSVHGSQFVENIGWGVYSCSDTDCTEELEDAIKSTFEFFYGEKNKSYRPHYESMMSDVYKEIGLGIVLDSQKKKYYLTVHYGTQITSSPTPICEGL